MDVTRRDHIKNVDMRADFYIREDIVGRIHTRRLGYFGHVVTKDQHRLPYTVLYGRVEGNRPKGRPRKRWLDDFIDDCYHRGWNIVEATHLATDRQCYRTYIYTAVTACLGALGIAMTTKIIKLTFVEITTK